MTALRAAGASDVGIVRNNNEDRYLVADDLFAVADGMGGHVAGEVAAQAAVEALRVAFDGDHSASGLVGAALRANRVVWERSQREQNLRGMGTTLSALALVDEEGEQRLAIVHIGDSRAYRLHNGELEQLTEDHSLINDLLREGQISPDEAAIHPQRHVLSRALGVDPDVQADLIQVLPSIGDRILLCSDGLTRELTDHQIASILRRLADPKEAVKALISEARASGGNDNITAVLVDVVDDDEVSAAASAALAHEPVRPSPPTEISPQVPADGEGKGSSTAESVVAVPVAAPDPMAEPRKPVLTLRVIGFLVALIAVLAVAALVIGVYARGTYFVGLDSGQRVTVFKGRPGGVLWFKPTVDHYAGHPLTDLLPQAQEQIRANKQEPSRAAADSYITRNLLTAAGGTSTTTSTTVPTATSTVTSTTVPTATSTTATSKP